jgi:chromatin structure-remodeling complex subunit RSC1/2
MDVDVEVDVGGGQGGGTSDVENDADMEGEAAGEEMPLTAVMARDAESDEIVHQLERGLRTWEGFGDRGWMEEVSMVRQWHCRVEDTI